MLVLPKTRNPGSESYKMLKISKQNEPDLIICLFQTWLFPPLLQLQRKFKLRQPQLVIRTGIEKH